VWDSTTGKIQPATSEQHSEELKEPDPMSTTIPAALFLIGSLLCSPLAAENRDRFFKPGAIRALILTGRNNHDWRTSSQFLKETLVKTGRFDVRVIEEPAGLTEHTLSPYEVLILDYQGPRWGDNTEAAVSKFVAAGNGLVVVHGASYSFSGLDVLADYHVRTGLTEPVWSEYVNLTGGVWSQENPKSAHGARHRFEVKFADRGHPVARGMEASFFSTDELYHDLKMHPSAQVLGTAFSAESTGGTGEEEPILWTMDYGKGRVFHTALGHDMVAMVEDGFVTTFLRGTEWTATGKVSLPSKISVFTRPKNVPRVLVVTGGHDYDSEFYTLFEGAWLTWTHAASNKEAFAKEIQDRFDVVVLYDMSRQLGDEGKKNLRSFVERGRGLVVLHHALADYNSWEWWWKEVVGGRYILEEHDPHSSYQHDVEMYVKSVNEHPITRDLGPFHLWDESYKEMWISPGNTVLMETDAPTSDPPVAWISPYKKSKVVAIQLGHDRMAHLHPGFRELVKRSILWTAGKLR
jgi:type 1 glutamine amidotransferase